MRACAKSSAAASARRTNSRWKAILTYRGSKFVDRFDANSYIYITRAMDDFDLTQRGALSALFDRGRHTLPGRQLYIGLALSLLSIAGDRQRAAQPQLRRGVLQSGIALRP